jgi:excisionase family DNA binding protein
VPAPAPVADQITYRPRQAAAYLGIGKSLLYELLAAGEIKARRLGSATLILRDELDRFAAQLDERDPADVDTTHQAEAGRLGAAALARNRQAAAS